MSRKLPWALALVLLIAIAAGCSGRRSPSGFRLPPGDVDAGQKAFVDLQCSSCHSLPGADMPAPTSATPIALGGRVLLPPTDGDLTTDIILPASHFAGGYPAARCRKARSRRCPTTPRRSPSSNWPTSSRSCRRSPQ